MSVPFTTPALQAVTPLGILGYFREAEAAMTQAANNDQIADLQARAQVVNQIFQSVMDNCQKQITLPGKVVNKSLDAVIAKKIPTAVKIEQTRENFDYNALKGSVVKARNKALQTIEALRLSLQSSSPSPAPSEEEHAEPAAPEPFEFVEQTNTLPPAAFEAPAAFSQFGTFVLPKFQGPFVFTAGQTDDAAPAALPSAEKEEDAIHAAFVPTVLKVVAEEDVGLPAEEAAADVPTLVLTALPGRTGSTTPLSEAPSESDNEGNDLNEDASLVAARSQQQAAPAAKLPDDIIVPEESDNSGDEFAEETEDRKETGSPAAKPADIQVEDEETTTRCRPGRKTACAAVTTALAGVGYFFRDRLVEAAETAVTTVSPHATALWTGVKAAVVQRSSQLAGLAVTAWEKAPSRTELLNAVVEPISEELASDELVHPSLPITRSQAAQATLVIGAVTLIKAGHYLTSRSKPKAD